MPRAWMAAALTLLLSPAAFAQGCLMNEILEHVYEPGHKADLELSTCKVWPARPDVTLVAAALNRQGDDKVGSEDLELLLVDTATSKVITRRLERDRLGYDAIRVGKLTLDTAPYKLNDNLLAFGLRISRHNNSGVYPFSETSLTLYTLGRSGLEPVLENLLVNSFSGETDTVCQGRDEESAATLALRGATSHGLRSLLVTQHISTYREVIHTASTCMPEDEKTTQHRYTLTFDGQRYPVPAELQALTP
ncbi:hypothetical protein IQ22_04616 [Pseudomonas duriflava]|uniref:Uncharacterized protein n=1 Tax=Pseudomonas duriflava TaxID=459528 RepID=A0A562PNJ7_9PSED|nr:hypothetical protein [Pseudomonas duriflava]TWI45636.1 hypothetical protein IQ22_04616 [Pseudomonas duriflava]